jgi:glycosyltransferase involved in cell wall biosynthesis
MIDFQKKIILMNVLLIGPLTPKSNFSGEDTYIQSLLKNPPAGINYFSYEEIVKEKKGKHIFRWDKTFFWFSEHRLGILPYSYLFSFDTQLEFDLIHIHAVGVHLGSNLARKMIPMIASASSYPLNYYSDYIGWDSSKVKNFFSRAKFVYRALNIQHSLFNSKNFDRLVVWSDYAKKDYIQAGFKPDLIDVIPPSQPMRPKKTQKITGDPIRFLFVGNDFHRKGGDLLISAFEMLQKKHPDRAQLTIISREAPEIPPADGIVMLAEMDRSEVMKYYENSDIFVLPSRAEGYGMSVVEALSYGLPCITSDLAAFPEINIHAETGFIFPANDAEALSTCMEKLIENNELARIMSEKAQIHAEKKFSPEITGYQLHKVYESVLRTTNG